MKETRPARWTATLALLCCAAAGCGETILEQEFAASGPGDVDMLWIVDNSASMTGAQITLSTNFGNFVEALPGGSTTLMGITTTQAWPCADDLSSEECEDDVGTAGRLARRTSNPALMDPSDPVQQELFVELVHVGVHGSGFERAMQVALMAACEAASLPADSDFVDGEDDLEQDFPYGCSGDEWDPEHELYEACHCLPREVSSGEPALLRNANAGLLRGNPLHVVVVTDEGDATSDIDKLGGEECADIPGMAGCDCRLRAILRLIGTMVPELRVSVIGPGQGLHAGDEAYLCNPMGSSTCAMDFLHKAVAWTDGMFTPILEPVEDEVDCVESDFSGSLADLVLFHPAVEWFDLQLPAVEGTLEVSVNDVPIPEFGEGATCSTGSTSGGWVYRLRDQPGVSILGDCTPFAGDVVHIRYEATGPVLVVGE